MPNRDKVLTVAPLSQRIVRWLKLDRHPLPCMAAKQVDRDDKRRREEALERQIRRLREKNMQLADDLLETKNLLDTHTALAAPQSEERDAFDQAREELWLLKRQWAALKAQTQTTNSPARAVQLAADMAAFAPRLAKAHETFKRREARLRVRSRGPSHEAESPVAVAPPAPKAINYNEIPLRSPFANH